LLLTLGRLLLHLTGKLPPNQQFSILADLFIESPFPTASLQKSKLYHPI
jgi:hypothetical protein